VERQLFKPTNYEDYVKEAASDCEETMPNNKKYWKASPLKVGVKGGQLFVIKGQNRNFYKEK